MHATHTHTSKHTHTQPLTEEEVEEREQLLKEGFASWTKRDFSAFTRACEKHGRTALTDIAKDVEGKTLEEVREYAKVGGVCGMGVCGKVV